MKTLYASRTSEAQMTSWTPPQSAGTRCGCDARACAQAQTELPTRGHGRYIVVVNAEKCGDGQQGEGQRPPPDDVPGRIRRQLEKLKAKHPGAVLQLAVKGMLRKVLAMQ